MYAGAMLAAAGVNRQRLAISELGTFIFLVTQNVAIDALPKKRACCERRWPRINDEGSMMTVRGVWFGLCRRRRVVCDLDHCAHPGVNAALETTYTDWKLRTSRRGAFLSCARGNEKYSCGIRAFRSDHRVPGKGVKVGEQAAAKFSHARKRMCLAADVLDEGRPSNVQVRLAWLIAPFVRILGCC